MFLCHKSLFLKHINDQHDQNFTDKPVAHNLQYYMPAVVWLRIYAVFRKENIGYLCN